MAKQAKRLRDRQAGVMFRMSPEERQQLHERAQAAGLTLQAYLEHIVFEHSLPEVLPIAV